jgi:hypothetical protein
LGFFCPTENRNEACVVLIQQLLFHVKEGFMEWFSGTADTISILGATFAFFAWKQALRLRREFEQEQQRQNRKVTVVLQSGADRLELPVELRRAELTRAEILGRLGMIPMKVKGQRFSLGYLYTSEFLRQINDILASSGDAILTIPCKEDEFAQFDISSTRS